MLDIFCFSYPPFWVLSAQVNMVNVGSYLHSSCQTQMGFKLQIPYMLCCGFIMQIVQLQCSYPLLASLFMWFSASISNMHVILWILSVHAKVLEFDYLFILLVHEPGQCSNLFLLTFHFMSLYARILNVKAEIW